MTECAGAQTVSSIGAFRIGSSGKCLPGSRAKVFPTVNEDIDEVNLNDKLKDKLNDKDNCVYPEYLLFKYIYSSVSMEEISSWDICMTSRKLKRLWIKMGGFILEIQVQLTRKDLFSSQVA